MKAILGLLVGITMTLNAQAALLVVSSPTQEISLDVSELVQNTNVSHEMYGPFRRKDVLYQGYALQDFLHEKLAVDAKTVRFQALDGYSYTIESLEDRKFILVFKEDGHPLGLRDHGPARLIETDLNGRDVRNISLFDDWVWMIQRIEVLDE